MANQMTDAEKLRIFGNIFGTDEPLAKVEPIVDAPQPADYSEAIRKMEAESLRELFAGTDTGLRGVDNPEDYKLRISTDPKLTDNPPYEVLNQLYREMAADENLVPQAGGGSPEALIFLSKQDIEAELSRISALSRGPEGVTIYGFTGFKPAPDGEKVTGRIEPAPEIQPNTYIGSRRQVENLQKWLDGEPRRDAEKAMRESGKQKVSWTPGMERYFQEHTRMTKVFQGLEKQMEADLETATAAQVFDANQYHQDQLRDAINRDIMGDGSAAQLRRRALRTREQLLHELIRVCALELRAGTCRDRFDWMGRMLIDIQRAAEEAEHRLNSGRVHHLDDLNQVTADYLGLSSIHDPKYQKKENPK